MNLRIDIGFSNTKSAMSATESLKADLSLWRHISRTCSSRYSLDCVSDELLTSLMRSTTKWRRCDDILCIVRGGFFTKLCVSLRSTLHVLYCAYRLLAVSSTELNFTV